jgi:hypothetical protein
MLQSSLDHTKLEAVQLPMLLTSYEMQPCCTRPIDGCRLWVPSS